MHTYTKIVIVTFIIYMKFDRLQEEFDSNWRIMGKKIKKIKLFYINKMKEKLNIFHVK